MARSTVGTGTGAVAYSSVTPAARMQIITRPLSGVPADAGIKLSSRERFRFVMAIVITVLFLAFLAFMLAISSGTADLGINLSNDPPGHQVVTSVTVGGVAYASGVHSGDIVTGDTGDGNLRKITITHLNDPSSSIEVSAASNTIDVVQRLIFVILALIFIGVGGPVYVKARQRVAASAFYAFCVSSAICLAIVTASFLGQSWITVLMFISLMIWSGSFAFFFFKFPVRVGKTRRRHRLFVATIFATGAITVGSYLYIYAFYPELYQVARSLGYFYMAFCVILGLASLGYAFVRERSPEVRQQMTIVLGGTALAVGPTLLLAILPSIILPGGGLPATFTALTLGLMPLSFAYAITQGQMLGVRNFIRRGVVYVLMGFGVLLALSVVVIFTLSTGASQLNVTSLILFSVFVFLIAISYGYVQKAVERLVDKYVYHDAYDYKEALLNFSAQLAAEQNLPTLADELVLRTCRMMNLSCGVLLLAAPVDKSADLRAEMLFNDMDLMDGGQDVWGALRDSEYTASTSGDVSTLANGNGKARQDDSRAWSAGSANPSPDPEHPLRVVPYARYGEFAEWLIEGLNYELSQMGIRLDEADAPMQLVYFSHQGDADDTSRLRTQQLREDAFYSDAQATVTGALHNSSRNSGSLNGHLFGRSNGTSTDSFLNTGSLRPSQKVDFESIRSFLGVPLWTRSRFVGVLCLGGKRTGERFTRDDLSLLSTLGSQAALAIYNAQLYEAREQALLDTIAALAHAIEAKDGYTIQHSENLTGRAVALAQSMGLPPKDVENIRMGAILHDIGKIGIPDAVLNKPGRLTTEEYELMKQHAAIGARIVQSVGALQGVVPIVRYHQERYDGSGYPEGLKGEDIPIGARIIGVVDTYGAMTEDRVYRSTPGHDKAMAELRRLAGQQFDPVAVEAFVHLLEERPDLAEHPAMRV